MKKRFLENTPLFAVLSDDERQALADRFALHHVPDDATLFGQGEGAERMFLVRSGLVRLGEAEQPRATFGPSSLLGDVDLLLNRPHGATATAQGPAEVWVLDRAGLGEAVAAHPTIAMKLSTVLGERVRDIGPYLVPRLRRLSILSELDDATLAALADVLALRDMRRGALIFQAGTQAQQGFFVESGTVTLVSTAPDDPEPFRQLGPGELFGLEAMLRDRPYGSVARAATDGQLWALSRADLDRVSVVHPALRQTLAAHVGERALLPADRSAARVALARVPIFAGLPDEVLDALANRLALRHAGTNETIFNAGDPSDTFFLVDRGVVKLLDGGALIERKEDGGFFGEMALLTGKPREWTARTARNTNLWTLAKRDFDAIAVRFPPLTAAVSRALAQALASEAAREGEVPLAMFPLFTGLTPREQGDVARRLRTLSVRAGETVFRRGAVADALYLLRQGQLRLAGDSGTELVRAGGFFGEMALLTGNPHTFTAQAVEDSELLALDRAQFEAVMGRYPSVALVLSRALGNRLEAANLRGVTAPPIAPPPPAPARDAVALPAPPPRPRPTAGAARPPRRRSRWAAMKAALVLLPLLWLAGVSLPTMLREPVYLSIIATPTPRPTPTPVASPSPVAP